MKNIVKKIAIYSMVGIMQAGFCASAIEASPRSANEPTYHNKYEHDQEEGRNYLPFNWHERRENFTPDHHRMERIDDNQFNDKFPGRHAYKWHDNNGEGFMYHGHRVTDAVFFYNDSDELVSIGFVYKGVFVKINADSGEERSNDSFFVSWFN
ncbi:MAG: hypothetical protein Q8912_10370 [Bacillota bacterium]|nr:hypothetical protein [Bacillota bacterium]